MNDLPRHPEHLRCRIETLSKKEAWLRERGLTASADRLAGLSAECRHTLKWVLLRDGVRLAA